MRQFIPFEDDWDALAALDASRLVPYQAGLPCLRDALAQCTAPMSPSTPSSSPTRAPIRCAVPADSSST